MNANAIDGTYTNVQQAQNISQPATAPQTSATQPANSATPQGTQSASQSQAEPLYFYSPNLGRHVNILV